MTDVTVHNRNESFVKVECDRSIAQELSSYFEFYVPGFQFTPAYKNKIWDGKIRLYDTRNNTIYRGLLHHIENFCSEREYSINVDKKLKSTVNFTIDDANKFIKTLNLPFEVRDYQVTSFVESIKNKRLLLVSPTGSGKSLIIYLIIRFLQLTKKRGLLLVPNVSLVSQMYKDFESYGYESSKYCHKIHQGKDKNSNEFLFISTWQSIYTLEPEYFEQFEFIIGDEAHQFKSKSLTTILSNCVNAKYRIGTTGTLDGTQTHRLVLEGLFGNVYKSTTTTELIQNKQLSNFEIKCLILKYPDETCNALKKSEYKDEIHYIVKNKARNQFIRNLTLSLEGNSLLLFQFVEKHGKELYRIIKEKSPERLVFFVYGNTDIEVRESVREITEKQTNAIIIASYGVFSTGINIRNLHNIIFASPSKSRVRNLQSIGRVLRLGDNKEKAVLYDIADDMRTSKYTNHTLNHFLERIKIYDDERFEYKFHNIELRNG